MRTARIERRTNETDIKLTLTLEGKGCSRLSLSSIGFLEHMLTLFCAHSKFDLEVELDGDTHVDYHHSVEDLGIALGSALKTALGDKKGIRRYADITLPMDEALVLVALDISGRSYLNFDLQFATEKIGSFDTELVKEFFQAFTREAGLTLHVKKLYGENSHHLAEAVFKAVARCLRKAVSLDREFSEEIPSSKGVL